MANTKEKLAILKSLHSQQEKLYAEKNEKYDDSFAKTYQEYGPAVALLRLEDKLNRAKALVRAGLDDSNGESLVDTLTDLANYSNMFLIELGAGPVSPEKPEGKKRSRKKKEGDSSTEEDEGPLGSFTKSQLIQLVEKLGGDLPKKPNRKKLVTIINKFPKSQVAVAITSISQEDDSEESEDGEE